MSSPSGSESREGLLRTCRSGWLGHQSRFVLGRVALGVGLGIAGFSLSLTLSVLVSLTLSVTSVLPSVSPVRSETAGCCRRRLLLQLLSWCPPCLSALSRGATQTSRRRSHGTGPSGRPPPRRSCSPRRRRPSGRGLS